MEGVQFKYKEIVAFKYLIYKQEILASTGWKHKRRKSKSVEL
jgi:hypothetical protein